MSSHCCRYGQIESLRLRSVPVKLDGKQMPRRAAVLTGSVSTKRGTANAYIVFAEAESVGKALASNMQLVSVVTMLHCELHRMLWVKLCDNMQHSALQQSAQEVDCKWVAMSAWAWTDKASAPWTCVPNDTVRTS